MAGQLEVIDGAHETDGRIVGRGRDGGVEPLAALSQISQLAGADPGIAAVERVDAAEIGLEQKIGRLFLGPFFQVGGQRFRFLRVAVHRFFVPDANLFDQRIVEGIGLDGSGIVGGGATGLGMASSGAAAAAELIWAESDSGASDHKTLKPTINGIRTESDPPVE